MPGQIPPLPFWAVRRYAFALLAAGALAIVTAIELNQAGGLSTKSLVGLSIIVGTFGPAESLARTTRDWIGHVSFEKRLHAETAAKAALVGLTEIDPALSWQEIGITVFMVQRAHWRLIWGIQQRIVRVRMTSTPRPSTVLWTRKKGILGKCWREQRDAWLDHQQFYAEYKDVTKPEWKKLPDDIRMGLTFRDFTDIRGYGFVLASPMKDEHGYRGCFVVQVPSEARERILGDRALEVIHIGAAMTCAVLP